jgi:hypothetical protein
MRVTAGHRLLALALIACLVLASACGAPSKHDILQKAEDVETKQQLLETLGEPDERSKTAFVETWRYEASDGTVVFTITGEKVMLKNTTGDSGRE